MFRDIETIKGELPDNKKQLEKAKVDLENTEAEEKKLCEEVHPYVKTCWVFLHRRGVRILDGGNAPFLMLRGARNIKPKYLSIFKAAALLRLTRHNFSIISSNAVCVLLKDITSLMCCCKQI